MKMTYFIARFHDGYIEHEIIKTGLTLEEAKAYCKDSYGSGWVDGYFQEFQELEADRTKG